METKPDELKGQVARNVKRPDHPVKTALISKRFFGQQDAVEQEDAESGRGSGGDFNEVFRRTVAEVVEFARERGWPDEALRIERATQDSARFLEDFAEIKMDDTFYKDLDDAFLNLFKEADGVIVYTTGDPKVQPKKIKNSRIIEHLERAKEQTQSSAYIGTIVAGKKEAEIEAAIEDFERHTNSKNLQVIVYDDNISNFAEADFAIGDFERKKGREVDRQYVWAKAGRIAEEIEARLRTVPEIGLEYETAETLGDLVKIIQSKKTDDSKTLVLLDFDGAVSDNRLMRARQAHVVYLHIMRILKVLVQEHAGWDKKNERTADVMRQ